MKRSILSIIVVIGLSLFSLISYATQTIKFGVIYFYPPFVFSTKSGYIHGFDFELAKTLCQRINTQCSFTAMPLSQLFSSLNSGKVDAIMGAISITPARQAQFDFTKPYFKSPMSYVTLNANNIDLNNLQGKKLGVEKDSTFYTYINEKYKNQVKIIAYLTNEALVAALSNHEVDIIALDGPAAKYWIDYSTGLFKMVGTPEYLPFDQGYGIAVRKGNIPLLNKLNGGLTSVTADGTVAKLAQSYFK